MLYDGSGGLRGLARAADEAASKGGARINAILLHSRKDPAREVCEWVPDDRRPDVALEGGKAVLTLCENGKDPIRIAVVRSGRRRGVYYALSDCPAADFKARFVSLVERHVPTISRMYLSNAEICSVVDAAFEIGDARIRFVTTRSWHPRRQKPCARTKRIDEPAEKLADADIDGGEIRTVKFSCEPDGQAASGAARGPEALTVSRDCRFSARRGTGVLFDAVLPRAADVVADRSKMLLASARTANRRTPEPLIVRFGRHVFDDPGKNRGHVDAIGAMPRTAMNEYHVNPYIHVAVVDYRDCSSYDIWVLVGNKLAIIPRFSATGASMARLVNHVMEKFGDATIEKYDGG